MLQGCTWLKARPELSTQGNSQTVPVPISRALWSLQKSPLHKLGVQISKHTVSPCHWWEPSLEVTELLCWWVTTYSLSSVNWEVSHFFFLVLVKETSRKLYLAYRVHVTFLLNEAALEDAPAVPAPNFGAHVYLPEWYGMKLLWWPKAGSLQLSTLHLLDSHKHNGTQGITVWTGGGVNGLESRRLLWNSWVPSPIIHIRGSWSRDAQLWGHLTPLVSEDTHLHSHSHAHC